MKKYMKPSVEVANLKLNSLLSNGSITGTSGAKGLGISNDSYGGGSSDARDRGSRNSDSFEDLW